LDYDPTILMSMNQDKATPTSTGNLADKRRIVVKTPTKGRAHVRGAARGDSSLDASENEILHLARGIDPKYENDKLHSYQ